MNRQLRGGMLAALGGAALLIAAILPARLAALFEPAAADLALSGRLVQGGWARGIAPGDALSLSFDGKPVALAADRHFFLAFDRDAAPVAQLRIRRTDGSEALQQLAIAPRDWQIEHIPLGPRPGTPPDEAFRIRRETELARIGAARAVGAKSEGWRQSFIWPVTGRLSGHFGSQRIYNGTPGALLNFIVVLVS